MGGGLGEQDRRERQTPGLEDLLGPRGGSRGLGALRRFVTLTLRSQAKHLPALWSC